MLSGATGKCVAAASLSKLFQFDVSSPARLWENYRKMGIPLEIKTMPEGADYPFHQIVEGDVWGDDPALPHYNEFAHVDPKNAPPWFEKEKMRRGDFAYRWLVEIRHNADHPKPGFGSAIFFHIRRGVNRPTAGCTTMAEPDLVKIITWLRAPRHPCYALLPSAEYDRKWQSWHLPQPESWKVEH